MATNSLDLSQLFDAGAFWKAGGIPWTFFVYPTSLADEYGLPPDVEAKRLLAKLQDFGLQVGVWSNTPIEQGLTYFACPKDDIKKVIDSLQELETQGYISRNFCTTRSEYLISLVDKND